MLLDISRGLAKCSCFRGVGNPERNSDLGPRCERLFSLSLGKRRFSVAGEFFNIIWAQIVFIGVEGWRQNPLERVRR